MSRLLLIRHGQTTSNIRHALDTALPGAALTELGWSQAHAAGERLARERDSEQDTPLALLSSQALRARQTAAGIATAGTRTGLSLTGTAPGSRFADALAELTELQVTDGVEAVGPVESPTADAAEAFGGGDAAPVAAAVSAASAATSATSATAASFPAVMPGALPGISEIPAGHYEMRVDDEAHDHYHRTFGTWLSGSMDAVVPGADSGHRVVGRYLDTLLPVLATAQRAGTDLAVVSHGAVIRLVSAYLGRVDPEFAVRTLLPNTSRVELEVPELAGTARTAEAVAESWKVVDWAGAGEPPRVR